MLVLWTWRSKGRLGSSDKADVSRVGGGRSDCGLSCACSVEVESFVHRGRIAVIMMDLGNRIHGPLGGCMWVLVRFVIIAR